MSAYDNWLTQDWDREEEAKHEPRCRCIDCDPDHHHDNQRDGALEE